MAITKKERAVIEAAMMWCYCPQAGGYADGPAIEDGYERLVEAVTELTGINPEVLETKFRKRKATQQIYWPTVKEVNAALRRKTVYKLPE